MEFLNYSSREEYSDLNSICHPIIRNCLQILNIKKPIELASFGEPLSALDLDPLLLSQWL